MCNPRRIRVQLTQELREEWEHQIAETAVISGEVAASVTMRRPTDMSDPVHAALIALMQNPEREWIAIEGGFLRSVEGGHVIYHTGERELEIVSAVRSDVITEVYEEETLRGVTEVEITEEGEGGYYEDGYAGQDEAYGKVEAEKDAQRKVKEAGRAAVEEDREAAEAAERGGLRARATAKAEEQHAIDRAASQEEAQRRATDQHEAVGRRAMAEFHQLTAEAYRDAMIGYAQANAANGLQVVEEGDTISIEFRMTK